MDRSLRCTVLSLLSLLALAPAARADVFKTTTSFDTFDGVCDEDCSLRDAVVASNANPGPDTILLHSGPKESALFVLTLTGPDEDSALTGDLDIAFGEELKILGSGPSPSVVTASVPSATTGSSTRGGRWSCTTSSSATASRTAGAAPSATAAGSP
jgi:CSLREA domain-containing protein